MNKSTDFLREKVIVALGTVPKVKTSSRQSQQQQQSGICIFISYELSLWELVAYKLGSTLESKVLLVFL